MYVPGSIGRLWLWFAKVSQRFLEDEGRYNYTTPKSFLELIDFYKELLRKKRGELDANINRLANGLQTLRKTNDDVQVMPYSRMFPVCHRYNIYICV